MIAGILLVAALVARELFRAADPDGRAAQVLGTVLVPVAIAFALVAVVRFADLVVGRV